MDLQKFINEINDWEYKTSHDSIEFNIVEVDGLKDIWKIDTIEDGKTIDTFQANFNEVMKKCVEIKQKYGTFNKIS